MTVRMRFASSMENKVSVPKVLFVRVYYQGREGGGNVRGEGNVSNPFYLTMKINWSANNI